MGMNDSAVDAQLTKIATGTALHLCSAEPASYSEVVTLTLANKPSPSFSAISDYEIGRTISISLFNDGVATGSGDCTWFALVSDSELLLAQKLVSTLTIAESEKFYFPGMSINIPNSETFLEADRPDYTTLVVSGVSDEGWIAEPWNYDDTGNSERLYPLVIYFNAGSGTALSDAFSSLPSGFGVTTDGYQVGDYGKTYPALYWLPRPATGYDSSRAETDVDRLDWIKANYRIDTDRIYLAGYSAGGQACHYLVDANYLENGHDIASIVRFTGGYKPDISDPLVTEWLHQGLADSDYRITNMELIYSNYKTNRTGGVETTSQETISGYSANNDIYTISGVNSCILTEYTGADHLDVLDGWANEDIMKWLFEQRG